MRGRVRIVMMMITRRYLQLIPLLFSFLLLSSAAYAIAVVTRGPTPASTPAGASSGYSVSQIHYTLSTTNPSMIAEVAFTVVPDTAGARIVTVRAKLTSAGTGYLPCTNIGGAQRWACPGGGVAVAAADQLTLDVGLWPSEPPYRLLMPIIRN